MQPLEHITQDLGLLSDIDPALDDAAFTNEQRTHRNIAFHKAIHDQGISAQHGAFYGDAFPDMELLCIRRFINRS